MRISLAIDSATADEAHDFVCAYQRTAGLASGEGDPTVTIGGSWSFGIATPTMQHRRVKALLVEFEALRLQRQEMSKLSRLLATPSPSETDS